MLKSICLNYKHGLENFMIFKASPYGRLGVKVPWQRLRILPALVVKVGVDRLRTPYHLKNHA
jgi:hypothetical protein